MKKTENKSQKNQRAQSPNEQETETMVPGKPLDFSFLKIESIDGISSTQTFRISTS